MGFGALTKPADSRRLRNLARPAQAAELRTRMRMGKKGRIVIPAAMRVALAIADSDMLDLRVVNGELRITTRRERLRRAQEWARKVIQPGVSLADELSAERREAAKYE